MDAGVALSVCNVTEPRHPLKMCEQRSFFKLFSSDVGLLCAMAGMDVVKSGKDYRRHSALSKVLSSSNYDIKRAVVLCEGNVRSREKVDYLPVYMTAFL